MKTELLQVRVTPELKTKLEQLASKDRRSLSDYVRVQLELQVEREEKNIDQKG